MAWARPIHRPRRHRPVPLEDSNDGEGVFDRRTERRSNDDKEPFRDDDVLPPEGGGGGEASEPAPPPSSPPRSPRAASRAAYVYAGCAALNSLNVGYTFGVGSTASILVQRSLSLADGQVELYTGVASMTATAGALFSHVASDGPLGRRGSIAATAVGMFVGMATATFGSTFGALLLGRAVVGLSVGVGLSINTVFIAEIAPAEVRGNLVSWSEIGINVGILLGYASALAFSGVPEDVAWRCMYGVGTVPPLCVILLVAFVMPESPRWLVLRGREEEASDVLARVHPEGRDVRPIVSSIGETARRERRAEDALGWRLFLRPPPSFRRMLLVGVGASVAPTISGISAIGSYLIYILAASGIESRSSQAWALIVLQLLKVGVIFVAAALYDNMGRRPLFFASLAGMTAALGLLSVDFYANADDDKGPEEASGGLFALLCLAVYLSFFSLGMGLGGWLIPSEVFPSCVRAKAVSLAIFSKNLASTAAESTLLSFVHVVSWGGTFVALAAACVLVAIFLHVFLPETKGRTLEDMADYFADITNDRSMLDLETTLEEESDVDVKETDVADIELT